MVGTTTTTTVISRNESGIRGREREREKEREREREEKEKDLRLKSKPGSLHQNQNQNLDRSPIPAPSRGRRFTYNCLGEANAWRQKRGKIPNATQATAAHGRLRCQISSRLNSYHQETSSREQRLPRDAGKWAHPALAPAMRRRLQYEFEYEAGG
jgi:hypothetical protein